MRKLLLRWILLALSVAAASVVTQALDLGFRADVHGIEDFIKLLVGVAILSFLNATLGKIIKLITLPLSCITLGLFSLAVNAAILMVAASLNFGFTIKGSGATAFLTAFVASLLISFINGVLGIFIADDKDD